jgi:site-specific DNA-cytosine methylase
LGYTSHFRLESARRAGLPHSRRRIFIGAIRNDLETAGFEKHFPFKDQYGVLKAPMGKGTEQWLWEPTRLVEFK